MKTPVANETLVILVIDKAKRYPWGFYNIPLRYLQCLPGVVNLPVTMYITSICMYLYHPNHVQFVSNLLHPLAKFRGNVK